VFVPVRLFSDAEPERLNRFPRDISPADLLAFFTLSDDELELIGDPSRRPQPSPIRTPAQDVESELQLEPLGAGRACSVRFRVLPAWLRVLPAQSHSPVAGDRQPVK
jgi:hypothetical protein